MASKYCSNASDVPKTQHWAIMVFGSITISGDERPRPDYQAWCRKYKTYQELVEAAIKDLS